MHESRHYWAVALLQSQALATDLTLNGLGQSCNARVRRASRGVPVQVCYYMCCAASVLCMSCSICSIHALTCVRFVVFCCFKF